MSVERRDLDPQLARIQRLLKAARLEVAYLNPADHDLRRAICGDLDDLLRELRGSLQTVVFSTRGRLPAGRRSSLPARRRSK